MPGGNSGEHEPPVSSRLALVRSLAAPGPRAAYSYAAIGAGGTQALAEPMEGARSAGGIAGSFYEGLQDSPNGFRYAPNLD